MTRSSDPPRLLDQGSEASSSVRELVASTRADEPTAAQIADVTARLADLLGPFGSPPPSGSPPVEPSTPAATSGSPSSIVRRLLPITVLGLLSAGAVGLWLHSSENASFGHLQRGLQTPARVSRSVEPEREVAKPDAPAIDRPTAPAASAAAPAADPEDELALLRKAHAAVRSGAGAKALELTHEHARLFPKSALAQEREVIAIESLVQLGRRSEAERRGERFLSGHSRSTHARRVAAILGKDLDAGAQ